MDTKAEEVVFTTKEDAELVLERLREILIRYANVTMQDLLDLVGLPTTYKDHKLGWTKLDNIEIRQIDKGYLLEFPPLEEINI